MSRVYVVQSEHVTDDPKRPETTVQLHGVYAQLAGASERAYALVLNELHEMMACGGYEFKEDFMRTWLTRLGDASPRAARSKKRGGANDMQALVDALEAHCAREPLDRDWVARYALANELLRETHPEPEYVMGSGYHVTIVSQDYTL